MARDMELEAAIEIMAAEHGAADDAALKDKLKGVYDHLVAKLAKQRRAERRAEVNNVFDAFAAEREIRGHEAHERRLGRW